MNKAESAIIYRGPSLIDQSPIVVVAIVKSSNTKTGNMVQTYILSDNGLDPMMNNKLGHDFSICGNCKYRGEAVSIDAPGKHAKGRKCYVKLFHGPLLVWKHLQKNGYPTIKGHAAIALLGADRMVRIGTYGDGAAVPRYIWDSLISDAIGHTAYSHQSDLEGVEVDPSLYMISADSEKEARVYWDKGQRTFRVGNSVDDIVKGFEALCPASKEGGRRSTCKDCKLCSGSDLKAKSIFIQAH